MHKRIVGVDLGGTRIRAASFDEHLTLLAREELPTQAQDGFPAVLDRIRAAIRAVLPPDAALTGIGIAAPGPLNPVTGVIVDAENLPGAAGTPVAALLRETFGVPVYLGNDANAAALGETMLGAARGCRHVVYITIGTGIGGGVIVDGRLLNGQDGMAAEIGFMLIVTDGLPKNLQDRAAGPVLARQARERIEQGERSLLSELVGGQLAQIDTAMVGRAAQMGDALALDIVTTAGRLIGMGAANLVHLFNPQMIVVGGGVSQMDDLILDPIRAAVQTYCIRPFWEHLRIVPAALGDNAGVVGAAALVVTEGGSGVGELSGL